MPTVAPKFWFLSSQWFASTAAPVVAAPLETMAVARTFGANVVAMISSGQVLLYAPSLQAFRALPMVTT